MNEKQMLAKIKELEEKVQLLTEWAKKVPPYINKTVNEIKSRLDALEQGTAEPAAAPAVDEAYLRRQERRMRQMATDLDILAADAMFG
jgi:hypothetical protein